MLITETAEAYHARKALSAGMAWQMVNECPLLAWFNSPFNPDLKHENGVHFDVGTALHLAVLEPEAKAERIALIDAADYRTNAAKEQRDQAYAEGKTPILLGRDWPLVEHMWEAVRAQTDLFDGSGQSEVTYTWEWEGVPCKARVDYLLPSLLLDLKTASSASPAAFQRAMIRDGHHLRAAWYLDGWFAQLPQMSIVGVKNPSYRFVIVGKDEPHIVTQFEIDERSTEWGRWLYRKALAQFRQCISTGIWPGYEGSGQTVAGEKIINISLPSWSEFQLADMEAEGKL